MSQLGGGGRWGETSGSPLRPGCDGLGSFNRSRRTSWERLSLWAKEDRRGATRHRDGMRFGDPIHQSVLVPTRASAAERWEASVPRQAEHQPVPASAGLGTAATHSGGVAWSPQEAGTAAPLPPAPPQWGDPEPWGTQKAVPLVTLLLSFCTCSRSNCAKSCYGN